MESGNTAIQVGPVPTEEEMGKVREYFSRALDAIVSHADITRQVQALSGQVSQLNTRLASAEHYANNLNQSLEETRQARDAFKRDSELLNGKLYEVEQHAKSLESTVYSLQHTLNYTKDDLVEVKKERDEAQFHNLELTEALEAERSKVKAMAEELKAFHDKVSTLLGNVAQAMQPKTMTPDDKFEQGMDRWDDSGAHAPDDRPYKAPEVASPHPSQATGTSTGTGHTQESGSGYEGQREPSPTFPEETGSGWGSPAPANSPEAPSQGASVGTGEQAGGGSQGEGFKAPGWDSEHNNPEANNLPDFLTKPVPHPSGHGVDTEKSEGYRHSDDDKYGF